MTLAQMHPEDVKAELKKRHRSVAAFERTFRLPRKSVNDVLRGRASARVWAAIEKALTAPVPKSEHSDNTNAAPSHRLSAGGR